MMYFIANWKANKNANQAVEWADEFVNQLRSHSKVLEQIKNNQTKIIICPPSPFIFYIKQILKEFPEIAVGVQDISQFEEGNHTGEVTASMLRGVAEYAIVGHSERRSELHEDESIISKKIDQLQKNGINSILCIRNEADTIFRSASLVAFEPVEAVGTGKNMNVTDVLAMKQKFALKSNQAFIYGGSVNAENSKEYLQLNGVDGFLVGKASLSPTQFLSIIY